MSDEVSGASSPTPPPPPAPREVDLGLPSLTRAIEIGRGAAGVVYRAEQPGINRTVAVKMLPFAAMDDAARQRFERECKAMGALSSHPGIVTVYDAGFTPSGQPFIIMELMEGGSLSDRLARQGVLGWEEVVEIGIRLCGALEAAHQKGVLHRDVKPDNVLISTYGETKLADFSIARVGGASLTQAGLVSATPAHAAPEILRGDQPTAVADVYSLASTLLTLMLGHPAFVRDTDTSIYPVLTRVERDPVPDLRPDGVPDPVCRVVERAMAKDPAARPPTAAAFAADLAGARDAALAGGRAGATAVAAAPVLVGAGFPPAAGPGGAAPGGAAWQVAGGPAPSGPGGWAPPGETGPAPTTPAAGGGRTRLLAIGAAAVVLLGGGGVALAVTRTHSSGPTSSSTSSTRATPGGSATSAAASSTDTTSASSSGSVGPGGLTGLLLAGTDLPDGFAAEDQAKLSLGDVDPCNVTPDTGRRVAEVQGGFAGGDPASGSAQTVGDAVGSFSSGGAIAYMDSVKAASHRCTTFTGSGTTATLTLRTGPLLGEDVIRLNVSAAGSGLQITTSYVIVRVQSRVAVVAVGTTGDPMDATADALAGKLATKLAG